MRASGAVQGLVVPPQRVESSRTRGRPVSPALASGFLATVPPGNSRFDLLLQVVSATFLHCEIIIFHF